MSTLPQTSSAPQPAWRRVKLGDVCSKPQYGWTTKATKNGGSLKLLRTTDITSGQIDWTTVPFCTEAPPDIEKYLVREGDILISRAGSVGVSHLVKSTEPAVFASYLIRFKPGPEVLPKYLAYFLQSPAYWKQIADNTAGIAVPNVNASKLQELELPLAPLDEQERIVAEIEKQFSRLDEAVANLAHCQSNLRRYEAAVLRAAVEGRLVLTEAELARREGRGYQTGAQLLARTLEVRRSTETGSGRYHEPSGPIVRDLPTLPKGWIWASALQVCAQVVDCHNKTAPYVDSGIPLIRTANIRDGRLILRDLRFVDEPTYKFWSRRCPPEPGDILFTREAPMGEATIIPPGHRVCMGQRMMLMRPSSAINRAFLLIALRSPVIKALINVVAVGSGVKHLRVGDAERMPIPLPPLAEQARIEREVSRRLSVVDAVKADTEDGIRRASAMRQAYLSEVFRKASATRNPIRHFHSGTYF